MELVRLWLDGLTALNGLAVLVLAIVVVGLRHRVDYLERYGTKEKEWTE